jgi:hypothetical protein
LEKLDRGVKDSHTRMVPLRRRLIYTPPCHPSETKIQGNGSHGQTGEIMTRLQTLVAWSAVSTALLTSANAQTVDDIINKYTDAIGGKAVLAGIQSMQIAGTVSTMGNDFPLNITIVNRKAFKSTIDANGTPIVQCVTDTGGWTLNPGPGGSSLQILSADQAKAMRSSIYIGGPLVDYKSKGFSAELLGMVDDSGVSAYIEFACSTMPGSTLRMTSTRILISS